MPMSLPVIRQEFAALSTDFEKEQGKQVDNIEGMIVSPSQSKKHEEGNSLRGYAYVGEEVSRSMALDKMTPNLGLEPTRYRLPFNRNIGEETSK